MAKKKIITGAPPLPMVKKPLAGYSDDPNKAAVYGQHTAGGLGVQGISDTGTAVYGWTMSDDGNLPAVTGKADGKGEGVYGESNNGEGVRGVSHAPGRAAVAGINDNRTAEAGPGVYGESNKGEGVRGVSHAPGRAAVAAINDNQTMGAGAGVYAESKKSVGVYAVSQDYEAVHAETHSPGTAAVAAYNVNPDGKGAALFAKKEGTVGHAGFFAGNVYVTGELAVEQDIKLINSADCAEEFEIDHAQPVQPGTVMVLGADGVLHQSERAYDKRVAGVISGAGGYKPGIVLDRLHPRGNRKPIALLGKVFCKVDAGYGPIEVGDLLTTSDTLGHAMKAVDPLRAFGSVLGKALGSLSGGCGLVPILVTLQ
ncbi:MAG TPA: hypothetical protein VGL91_23950 [Acidobacteriota bacterium]|jgi:hypothetical protein